MRILITGGAGFIGGHLAETFVREGHDVVVLDCFMPFYDTQIKEHNVAVARQAALESGGSYRLVRGDVRDADLVADLVAEADVVFHQAAQAGVRTSVEDPRTPFEINVGGTINVLEAARAADVERVVMAGSSSVYGVPEYLPYDEVHPTTPQSPYGASKVAADHYGRVYNEVYGLPTVTLRYFTVYGPRMRPNMAISNFVSNCMNDEPPVIYGDGRQTRDFTYIDDVVWANRRLLDTDAADGRIINVGSTDNIDILTLATEVRDQLAPHLEIQFAGRNAADAEHTHADVALANELVGYEPTTTIREGVSKFIEWYGDNRDWYEPLIRGEAVDAETVTPADD